MSRHSRAQYALLGLPATLNTLALLLVAFNATFRTGLGNRFVLALIAALVCLLFSIRFAVKRGHDLGWSGWQTIALFIVCTAFGPAVLLAAGVLLFMRARQGSEKFGPAPGELTLMDWLLAVLLAIWPWPLMLFARLI
ncbi:MAG: DUF805 domain-containing protein [Betaproteobacteria bacterium]|nr:DUF805 domain-containing protein [Betaproteobacteria bacterium]